MVKNLLNWEKVVEGGFGDRYNICAWSMVKFKGYLYVGTMNVKNGCQIYRSKTGNKYMWEKVSVDGFEQYNKSIGVRNMIVYNNLLWVVTYSGINGTQVWLTDGKNTRNGILKWKKANIDGFKEGAKIPGSRAMVIYKNKLYVGTQCKKGLPRIYRYDGSTEFDNIQPEKWTWINKEWKDDIRSRTDFSLIGTMKNFETSGGKEFIYAGFYSEMAALAAQLKNKFSFATLIKLIKFFTFVRCKIFRYDGTNWEQISKTGFGKPNIMAMCSAVLNDSIYFGTSNIFGAEIWKTKDGINWTRVAKKGFNYFFNIVMWSFYTFENKLIIGIQNLLTGGQIWASINEDPDSNKDFVQIFGKNIEKKNNSKSSKLKQDGVRTFEIFNGNLYAGTSSNINPVITTPTRSGCEVWRIKQL